MKNSLTLKLFLNLFVLFVIWKMNPSYTFFTLAIKQIPFGLNRVIELRNTSSTKYATSAFFGFPCNKENFEIINHLHLIFKYYLFKFWDTRKIRLEGLTKNIIKIYNIEKQICFNNS